MKFFQNNWLQLRFQLGSEKKMVRVFEVIFGSFIFIIPFCLVFIVLLGGCKHAEKAQVTSKEWKPQVELYAYPQNLKFSSGQAVVSTQQERQLRSSIAKATLATPVYARVMFNVPETHARKSIHQSRLRSIKNSLNTMGLENHRIEFMYASPSDYVNLSPGQAHHIIVSIDQYDVTIPECPDWKPVGYMVETQTEKNFGCATVVNLSHMISEPRDLYRSVALAKADGKYNANIVEPYRESAGSKGVDSDTSSIGANAMQATSAFIE